MEVESPDLIDKWIEKVVVKKRAADQDAGILTQVTPLDMVFHKNIMLNVIAVVFPHFLLSVNDCRIKLRRRHKKFSKEKQQMRMLKKNPKKVKSKATEVAEPQHVESNQKK